MWKTPERRAWVVLLTAFAIFCTLAISVPLSIRGYLTQSMSPQHTTLKPIDAAVHVRHLSESQFLAISDDRPDLAEQTVIVTDSRARAFLRLFESSTLTMYNNTEVVLLRTRSPRFDLSRRPNEIVIRVNRGRVTVAVALPTQRAVSLHVQTPHADIVLEEDNYSILVTSQDTQITASMGKATLTASVGGRETRTWRNGRCRVTAEGLVEGPLPPTQNLVANQNFTSVLGSAWSVPLLTRQDENDPLGQARIDTLDGVTALVFQRYGARTHGELSTTQLIDKDVRDFASLQLSCQVRVNHQSLPGGGFESTEFPIMIELNYRDAQGNPRARYWGFYYLDPGSGPEWRKMINGIKVVQNEWYFFESDNLMQSMGELAPTHIDSLRIYASGWDLDSAITHVSLLVQE